METKPRTWSWVLLFTTSATLICCALPIFLVTLGMGAAVATLASAAPGWNPTGALAKSASADFTDFLARFPVF